MIFPRRNRIDLNTSAELAIRGAILAVEEVGAHPDLTGIVIDLGRIKDRLADYLESVECGEPWCKGAVGEGCTNPDGTPHQLHEVRLRTPRPHPAAPCLACGKPTTLRAQSTDPGLDGNPVCDIRCAGRWTDGMRAAAPKEGTGKP